MELDLEAIRRSSAEPGAMFGAIIVRDLVTHLEQAEQAVQRVREVVTGEPTDYGWDEAIAAILRALDGEQA